MIEFISLGDIAFRGLDAERGRALRTRSQWLAVLAYLLVEAPTTPRRRDSVIAVFWPDAAGRRGRTSLRVALHALRKHIGADVIRSRGDEIVIERTLLTCDAVAFEARIAERQYAKALALYGGELLPGLQVRGASRFSDWLVEKRADLQRLAAGAAWALSAEAERMGRWVEAVQRARQAMSLSEESEASVRRLMRVLDRAGDRVSALREYDRFAARWHLEGLRPSRETEALAVAFRRDGLAREPAESTQVRPRSDRWPSAGSVVVLPFRILGDAQEQKLLAVGLAHDVIASLSRVSGISVAARSSADRLAAETGRDPAVARGEANGDSVLDVRVRLVADRFILVARLVSARTGTPFWADAYDFTADELLSVRARLIFDLLAALRVELSAVEQPRVAGGPTTSIAAYRTYLKGRSLWNRRTQPDVERAIRHFEEAVEIDSGFALAYAGLVDAHAALHPAAGRRLTESRARAYEAARIAVRLDPNLGETYATTGLMRAFIDQDWSGAIEDCRRAVELSPGHAPAHHWLGAMLTFVFRRFDEGAAELEIARQLDPYSPVIQCEIGLALLNRGQHEEARGIFATILKQHVAFWRAAYYLGIAWFIAGEPDLGIRHLERAWRLGAFGADPETEDASGRPTGDWRESLERKLKQLEASVLQPGTRSVEAAVLSMLLGQREQALRWLRIVANERSWAWIMGFFPVFEPLLETQDFLDLVDRVGLSRSIAGHP